MKKFSIKQTNYMYAITTILTIILLATSIVNLVAVSNSKALISQNPIVDIVASIVMIIIAIILVLFTFASHFMLTENSIKCYFAGFLKYYEIEYKDILLIRQSQDKKFLLIYANSKDQNHDVQDNLSNVKANIYPIKISDKYYSNFVDSIKLHDNRIIFEIV